MKDQRTQEERDHDWSLELLQIDKRKSIALNTTPMTHKTPVNRVKLSNIRKGGYNFEIKHEDNEKPYGPSETVPDQTMSLEQLLQRHINGIVIPNAKNPIWEEDMSHDSADLSKLNDLDLHDKEIIRQQTTQDIMDHRSKLEKQKAGKKEAAKKKDEGGTTPTEIPAAP